MANDKKFYVRAETGKGNKVIAYGVYDCIGGMESEHARYEVSAKQGADVALHIANTHRDDLNSGRA